jgi:hypothetical protein
MTEAMKELLNKSIREVITNQYKKDCPTAHEIVKDAGYEIYKYEGHYKVKNKETDKVVWFVYTESYYGSDKICCSHRDNVKNNDKFDFVNYLNKPFNVAYCQAQRTGGWRYQSKSQENYRTLKDARWDVQYHADSIEEIKGKIKKLQEEMSKLENDIAYHAREQVRAEFELERVRKDLGLA